ncbi:MAG: aminotransferase class V-fold PLP-dependent enzyme [Clostridium sp.]
MKKTYLDNGATSFPKPKEVIASMTNYMTSIGGNVNRGSYENSFDAENTVYETRELLCKFFNFSKPKNVIFTSGVTESLNVILKGLFNFGDHIIVSSMEHNAVLRPLNSIVKLGVEYTVVSCNSDGTLNIKQLENHIKPNTKAIVMTHSSNVCGTILPFESIGKLCKRNHIYFIVDTAQTAGVIPIDMKELNIDILCFTGHKSLLGPQGIGGFLISEELSKITRPLLEGGTGSFSEYEYQPSYMPDKFEGGTPNVPGIYGLNAGIKYINSIGIDEIQKHEEHLTQLFIDNILDIPEAEVIGLPSSKGRTAVVSLNFKNYDNGEISYYLDKEYGISVRCGLHCAPLAHKTLNTFPDGTVRFSFGLFNTTDDINYAIASIKKVIAKIK